MPGQSGSENRIKQIVRTTRWSPDEFAMLQSIANYCGCSEAEILRRLVRRGDRRILPSSILTAECLRIGNNLNQVARHLHSGGSVTPAAVETLYRDLLDVLREMRA